MLESPEACASGGGTPDAAGGVDAGQCDPGCKTPQFNTPCCAEILPTGPNGEFELNCKFNFPNCDAFSGTDQSQCVTTNGGADCVPRSSLTTTGAHTTPAPTTGRACCAEITGNNGVFTASCVQNPTTADQCVNPTLSALYCDSDCFLRSGCCQSPASGGGDPTCTSNADPVQCISQAGGHFTTDADFCGEDCQGSKCCVTKTYTPQYSYVDGDKFPDGMYDESDSCSAGPVHQNQCNNDNVPDNVIQVWGQSNCCFHTTMAATTLGQTTIAATTIAATTMAAATTPQPTTAAGCVQRFGDQDFVTEPVNSQFASIGAHQLTTSHVAVTIDGQVLSLSIYVQQLPSPPTKIALGLYTNNAGSPDTLLGQTAAFTVSALGWATAPIAKPLHLTNDLYWIAATAAGTVTFSATLGDFGNEVAYGMGSDDELTMPDTWIVDPSRNGPFGGYTLSTYVTVESDSCVTTGARTTAPAIGSTMAATTAAATTPAPTTGTVHSGTTLGATTAAHTTPQPTTAQQSTTGTVHSGTTTAGLTTTQHTGMTTQVRIYRCRVRNVLTYSTCTLYCSLSRSRSRSRPRRRSRRARRRSARISRAAPMRSRPRAS
jgi:hypothetical protein